MGVQLDLRKAHLHRRHGDILVVFTWVNDERAMVLIPAVRQRAPWFIVMEGAAYTWDDIDPRNVPVVAAKAYKLCDVLGIEPTPTNCRRVAGIVIDGLPDLIRMPHAPAKEHYSASHGHLVLSQDGKAIASEDIRAQKEGAAYA